MLSQARLEEPDIQETPSTAFLRSFCFGGGVNIVRGNVSPISPMKWTESLKQLQPCASDA